MWYRPPRHMNRATCGRHRAGTAAVLAALLAAAGSGCDALNPSLVAQIGGNSAATSVNSPGHVILVLNNLTNGNAVLSFGMTNTTSNGTVYTGSAAQAVGPGAYVALTLSCTLTRLELEEVEIRPVAAGVTPESVTVELPVNIFTPPALRCGSVVFVNVVGVYPDIGATAQLLN